MPIVQKRLRTQSALRLPLNRILGTETNVRILRTLYQLGVSVGTSELARHVEMDKAGVWRAIKVLEELGTVEAVGLGRQQTLRPREAHPLTRHLKAVFEAERLRFERLIEKLSEIARSLVPRPDSVWIEGSVATEHDGPGDPLMIGLLAGASEVGRIAEAFSRKSTFIEKQFSVAIETKRWTRADLAVMNASEIRSLDNTILLAGLPPMALIQTPHHGRTVSHAITHQDRDDQSLQLARAISHRLRRNRTLIRRALAYLKRKLATASPREAKELQEWRRLLQTYSLPQLRKLLTDPGERGTRLRQSSPFTPILTAAERADLLLHMSDQSAANE